MRFARRWSHVTVVALSLYVGAATTAKAADPPPPLLYLHQPVALVPSGCTFRFTPYGWLTSLHSGQTVRGRAVDVNASFVDIIDATLGSGGRSSA